MRITVFIIITFLIVITFNGNAQNIESWFAKQQVAPYQKLYLHTDREFYFEGDTLWFAAYLVDGQSQKIIPGACNLYVDLINGKGDLVKDELFILQNGAGKGYVAFSDSSMLEGNYLLRAYTDYLINFGNDAFFTKAIQISSHKNSFELEAEKTTTQFNSETKQYEVSKISSPEIDVSFLPEGGFLLAKESNCVAFQAVDKTGKGVDISGQLFDEQDNLVLTFKSLYKGAGKFYFYPKTGKKYTAKIDGYTIPFQLPEIKETGTKIKLINQEQNKIQLIVQSKNMGRNQNFYLVATHRGKEIFQLEIDRKKLNSILKISRTQLRGGINRFVLLNDKFNPISERLVFLEDLEINKLNVQVSGETFSTREEVQLNLRSDDKIMNDLARVSVSVVDENYVNASGISQNIASWLLLDSELKGHIESPASYLMSEDSITSQTKLDLLMTTNGWSNYIWNSRDNDSLKMAIEPQLGLTFKGHVKRSFGKKALSEGNASLIIFKSDSTSLFFDEPLDLNGNFEFKNVVFYDSASVFAQARNKKNKNTIQFDMELPKIVPPKINFANLNQLQNFSEIPFSVYRQRYLNEMRLREFYPENNSILIDDIEVKAKKIRPKFKTGVVRKDDGPFLLTWESTAGSFDIVEFLAYHVPGIYSYRNEDKELIIKVGIGRDLGIPGFFIDGYNYYSINEIKAFNVSDFKTIEVVTPPMSYAYGARGIYGAIVLTFRTGDDIDSTRPLMGGIVERINGLTPLREFYSPKYTPRNSNSETPDYRSTLYWNPSIFLTGEKKLFFNACDNISRYKVFVEGLTESGKVCLGEATFEVNSYSKTKR